MCLGLLKHSGNSEYLKNFDILLEPFGLSTDTVTNDSIKQITQLIQSNILENVRNKPSLSTIPLTGVFWKPSIHVAEGLWSTYLTRFRCQNAGLGNRSDSHKYYSSHDSKAEWCNVHYAISIDMAKFIFWSNVYQWNRHVGRSRLWTINPSVIYWMR